MPKIVFTDEFKLTVRKAWKDKKTVERLIYDEVVRLGIMGENCEERVMKAFELGLLLGQTEHQGQFQLFDQLTSWVNNNQKTRSS